MIFTFRASRYFGVAEVTSPCCLWSISASLMWNAALILCMASRPSGHFPLPSRWQITVRLRQETTKLKAGRQNSQFLWNLLDRFLKEYLPSRYLRADFSNLLSRYLKSAKQISQFSNLLSIYLKSAKQSAFCMDWKNGIPFEIGEITSLIKLVRLEKN